MVHTLSPFRHRRVASPVAFLSLLGLCAGPIPAFANESPPSVTSITPASAAPGDPIVLEGQGLDGPATEYAAWVRTQAAGFVLDDAASNNSGALGATVGPVAAAATGVVEVWRGLGHDVAPVTLRVDDRMVTAVESHLFVAHEIASGGPLFTVPTSSPRTVESALVGAALVLDLGPWPWEPDPPPDGTESIRVDVVIETGGSKTGTSGNGDGVLAPTKSLGRGPSWALRLVVEVDTPFVNATGAATALAAMLNQQFGSLGLNATATGTQLVLDSSGGIVGGFATLVADGG